LLNLAWFDIIAEDYAKAFNLLKEFDLNFRSGLSYETLSCGVDYINRSKAFLVSRVQELLGTDNHLRCNFTCALEHYEAAVKLNPENFEAALKLASAYIELGDLDKVRFHVTIIALDDFLLLYVDINIKLVLKGPSCVRLCDSFIRWRHRIIFWQCS